jgi:hypothetical protein
MKLEFRLIKELPRLAWAAHLRKGSLSMAVLHGLWVEIRRACFFEGAWKGPVGAVPFRPRFDHDRVPVDGWTEMKPCHTSTLDFFGFRLYS